MRRSPIFAGVLAALASAALLLPACEGGGSCPDPPECSKGKLCGCSCIAASKTCHKLDDGTEWADPADEFEDVASDLEG